MECPNCGATNRSGVRFCSTCGWALTTPPVTPSGAGSFSRSLVPGARLQGGRYDIKRVLGQGGMGAALLAIDNRLDGKRVVIKELLSDSSDPQRRLDDVRNFKREVSLLAHLDHPQIPSVTDHFQEGAHYFMVQEYVEGDTLEELLERNNQPLKEREVLIYASQLLSVLDYLEQQMPPIVHRDIKPANIVIGARDKRVHLVDFGIARAEAVRNAAKKQTSALGTPGYAPPEQYQGNADPRSDLYALAATLHHLLTNRDPRNHPPFVYPPVRTLNPALSPEIERVLIRALTNDINLRYQSAASMKLDIDDILLRRFGISDASASYALGASGPLSTFPLAASAPTFRSSPTLQAPPPPPVIGWQPQMQSQPSAPGHYVTPPPFTPPRSNSHLLRNVALVVLVLLVVGAGLFFGLPYVLHRNSGLAATPGATSTITLPSSLKNGIGTYQVIDKQTNYKEFIGISDGSAAFDTNRLDGALKQQAAEKFRSGDVASAQSLWQQALALDENDAEVMIYLEDQRVLASGNPYVTIVVGTMLTGTDSGAVGAGRDDLQGAYMAQKEYNSGFKLGNSVEVRLLIANSGSSSLYTTAVAQQIALAARFDKTIVGVMGWPYSSRAVNAISALAAAHIPLVSETASSDLLTGKSPYFFRVCPSDHEQGAAGADYATQKLHSKRVVLFVDHADAYSQSLANAFSQRYQADGGAIVATEAYTVGKPATLPNLLQDALGHNPDLLYFAGYASDVSTLLTNLPTTGQFARLQVMGGDALYELSGYPSSARPGFTRLHFTAFAYPDEWTWMRQQPPPFFSAYPQTFGANGGHTGYGYTRPDNDVILSYDAMLALLNGSRLVISGGKTAFTGADLQHALTQLTGAQAIQGVSGVIAFGPDGNPVSKATVVLLVDGQGHIILESVQGHFIK